MLQTPRVPAEPQARRVYQDLKNALDGSRENSFGLVRIQAIAALRNIRDSDPLSLYLQVMNTMSKRKLRLHKLEKQAQLSNLQQDISCLTVHEIPFSLICLSAEASKSLEIKCSNLFLIR